MERAILPPSFMITSIIGFIISAVYTASGKFESFFLQFDNQIFQNFGNSLGFAFCLTFILMFIASVISFTPSDKELSELK